MEGRAPVGTQEKGQVGQPNDADIAEAEEWVKARYKAALILSRADKTRHNKFRVYPENRYAV